MRYTNLVTENESLKKRVKQLELLCKYYSKKIASFIKTLGRYSPEIQKDLPTNRKIQRRVRRTNKNYVRIKKRKKNLIFATFPGPKKKAEVHKRNFYRSKRKFRVKKKETQFCQTQNNNVTNKLQQKERKKKIMSILGLFENSINKRNEEKFTLEPHQPNLRTKRKRIKRVKLIQIAKTVMELHKNNQKFDSSKGKMIQYKFLGNFYSFFGCYDCGNFFFGGAKDRIIQEYQQKSDKRDRICIKCLTRKSIKHKRIPSECNQHGSQFIRFKCRFCCNIASRFCNGIHFCERCIQNVGTVNWKIVYPCSCKAFHLDNGQEQFLGCLLCRDDVDQWICN